MTHKTGPTRQAAFPIIHKAKAAGETCRRVGVPGETYRRVGVSAGRRGRDALLRVRRCTAKEGANNL